ncbi:MAG: LysM peptidoglycan-binding domain-containing protein, partial [Chloroflexota bacterium]
FEDDDDTPPEVVDVEVITVVEAEPDFDDEVAPPPEPTRREKRHRDPDVSSTPAAAPVSSAASSFGPQDDEEVIPRRSRPRRSADSKPISNEPATVVKPRRRPKVRTSSDLGRTVIAPRKREASQEPTIIMPAETGTPNVPPARAKRTASRPINPAQARQRRARENTMPMEPPPAATPPAAKAPPSGGRPHRSVTQAMPVPDDPAPPPPVSRSEKPRVKTSDLPASTSTLRARQATQQDTPAPKSAAPQPKAEPVVVAAQTEESDRFTFGDVLRSFPSTFWTAVGGLALLIFVAVIIIGLFSLAGDGGIVTVGGQTPTPTLDIPAPGATPTLSPTATPEVGPVLTPGIPDMALFSSRDLDLTLDYPQDWDQTETDSRVSFSPTTTGIDPEKLALWAGRPTEDDATVTEMLAELLEEFPADAETLSEGTINIASQTWTSVQIRFEDGTQGPQQIANLAVTNNDDQGYYLVVLAPLDQWNFIQPTFQEMINSFRFGYEAPVAEAEEETDQSVASTGNSNSSDEDNEDAESEEEDSTSSSSTPTAKATPTPTSAVKLAPVTHVIKSGDTILAIAVLYGVDADLLIEENGIENPNNLKLGQELIIPFTAEQNREFRENGSISSDSASASSDDEEEDTANSSSDETDSEDESASASTTSSDDSASSTAAADETSDAAPVSGRIVYPIFNPGNNSYDVWITDLASGEQSILAGEASQPAFNKDGSLLAYRSWKLDTRGIFFRDFIGGRGGRVTDFGEDGLPSWSPDGYSFAFASRRESDRVARLFIGNQSGSGEYSIGFQGVYPSPMPDGRWVVKGCTPTGDCGMFVMGGTGGGEVKISNEFSDNAPAVSPDGSKIAFMSSERGARNWEIWLMNPDGSDPRRLTENGSNEGLPTWSPDGQSIAYVSDQGGFWAVWAMNADGTNQRKLFNMPGSPDGSVLHDKENSKGWLEERISWAP